MPENQGSETVGFDPWKYMPADQRKAPTTRHAGPGQSFPIRPGHPEDVRNAWDLAGHADNPEKIRANVRRIAKELGMADALPKTADEGKSLLLPTVDDGILVCRGGEVKSLGNGKIGGYLVRFGSKTETDLTGDFFTPETKFYINNGDKKPVLYEHGFDETVGDDDIGEGELKSDEVGIWIEAQLDTRNKYVAAIQKLAEENKLGWSSGSARHRMKKEKAGKSYHISRWPIVEATLTTHPADPRLEAVPLKSWAMTHVKALSYDDSYRDGLAAQAAVETLSRDLSYRVTNCFSNYSEQPKAERLAAIRAEFADFTEDSLAIIDALLDDDESTKSFLFHSAGLASDLRSSSPAKVVAAVGGFRDLFRRWAVARESDGRKLSEAKRADLKALIDGVSPIVADLQALLATHSAPEKAAIEAAAAQARLRLLALKHKRIGK